MKKLKTYKMSLAGALIVFLLLAVGPLLAESKTVKIGTVKAQSNGAVFLYFNPKDGSNQLSSACDQKKGGKIAANDPGINRILAVANAALLGNKNVVVFWSGCDGLFHNITGIQMHPGT